MNRTKEKKNLMMKEFKIASTKYVCAYVYYGCGWRMKNMKEGMAEKRWNRTNKDEKRTKNAKNKTAG